MAKSTLQSLTEILPDLTKKEPLRVLHVDDEAGFLEAAKQCLEMQGSFQVETASSVEEASEKLKKKTFDVVISDYVMPGKDGLQFLQELREEGNNIPFIMFTGKGREEVAIRALNLGADRYLNKTGHPEAVYGELAHSIIKSVKAKQAEEAVRESQQKFERLFMNNPEAADYLDPDFHVLAINPRFERLFGYSLDEIKGKHINDVIVPKDKMKEAEMLDKEVKKGYTYHDTVRKRKDGSLVPVSISAAPIIVEGQLIGSVGLYKDITERKKAEERIIQQNRLDKLRARIWEAAARIPEEKQLIQELLNEVGSFFNVDNAAFMRIYPERKKIICEMEWKRGGSKGGIGTEIPLWILKRYFGKPYILVSKKNVPKFARAFIGPILKRFGTTSSLVVPFGDIYNPRGYVTATVFAEEKDWTEDEVEILCEISRIISLKTDQAKTREALQESERRFRDIAENALEWIWEVDLDGKYTYASPVVERILGYKPKEVLQKHFYDLFHPEDREELEKAALEVFAKKQPFREFINRNVHKNGKTIWLSTSGVPVLDEKGNLLGYRGADTDITERKKTEKLFETVVELAPDSIITFDTKGAITSCNTATTRMLGYSKDEMIGKHFSKIGVIRVSDLPKFLKLFSSVLRGKAAKPLELTLYRKDGTPLMAEVRVCLLKEGSKATGIQAISRDITERKRAERAVRESKQKFEGLFRSNPEASVYVDPDYRILDVNPRFEHIFGYPLSEIKGKRLVDVIVPEDKLEEGAMLDKKAKKGHVYHDTVRKRKDGTLVPVAISAAPIAVEGKHVGYVGLYKDITRRTKAEEALKESLKNLETLTEKLDVVGKMTRHDVRNKLTAIYSEAYLAKMKLLRNHEALKHLNEIETSIGQAARIFDFAKTYEQLGIEEPTHMDVGKTIEEAVQQFPDLKVKVVNDCHGLTVLADSLLRQLFYNLIDNSLKYGEKVSQITIHHEAREDELKLVYEDDGVGIPKAEKERIFKKGYGKGTGYGLYLIKKICEVYGWTIQEIGTPGKGVQFTITIPKVDESEKNRLLASATPDMSEAQMQEM